MNKALILVVEDDKEIRDGIDHACPKYLYQGRYG